MKKTTFYFLLICLITATCNRKANNTVVSIKENQFYINDEITYKGRYWNNHKIEGLLFNSRMVQGIFDDLNPKTRDNFKYPDTKKWDAERNTKEFVTAMESWYNHGLLAFTLNLQGGSPLGYGNHGWKNTTFDSNGGLRPKYMKRLEQILDRANDLGMVVILGYFYFGQDQFLKNEQAVLNATDNITHWILEKGYRNILIEINNECDILYDHEILKPKRVSELIRRVKHISKNKLLVSTSYSGGNIPTDDIVAIADFILLHANGVEKPEGITKMLEQTRAIKTYTPKPILFNEDDHYKFDSTNYNLLSSIKSYASWGYFDFRREGENFENGFQSVPVDWRINSKRKLNFFNKLKEITGQLKT